MTDHFPVDIPRASGPAPANGGDSRALLVLDPAGADAGDGVPVAWRPMALTRRIVWCRVPAGGFEHARRFLREPEVGRRAVDVVSTGPTARSAVRLAHDNADRVRSLLLLDPAAEQYLHPTTVTSQGAGTGIRDLADAGVIVRVISHQLTIGTQDPVHPQLPLGHPEAVTALAGAVAELDLRCAEAEARPIAPLRAGE